MNRRSFFKTMVGGVAVTAAVRTWPFRVFSFPSEIKIVPASNVLTAEMLRRAVELMKQSMVPIQPVTYWVHPRDEKRFKEMFV